MNVYILTNVKRTFSIVDNVVVGVFETQLKAAEEANLHSSRLGGKGKVWWRHLTTDKAVYGKTVKGVLMNYKIERFAVR